MVAIFNFKNKNIPERYVPPLHPIVTSLVGPKLPETTIKHMLCLKTGFGGIPPDYEDCTLCIALLGIDYIFKYQELMQSVEASQASRGGGAGGARPPFEIPKRVFKRDPPKIFAPAALAVAAAPPFPQILDPPLLIDEMPQEIGL